MANMFKPEVGGTVGGTNISVYTPPSVDYSGLFSSVSNVFSGLADTGKAPSLSEGDKKAIALETISSGIDKVMQIEDPVKREVTWKKYKLNSYREFPQYTDDATKLFDKIEGYVYSDTGGKSPEDFKTAQIFDWAQKDEDGKIAYSSAYLSAGGDPDMTKQNLEVAYFKSMAEKGQLNAIKKQQELKAINKAQASENARPFLQAKADSATQQAFGMFKTVYDNAVKNGQDPNIAVTDAAAAERLQILGMINRQYNEAGLDPTTEHPESYLATFDAGVMAFEKNKDYFARSGLNQNSEKLARAVQASVKDPAVSLGILNKDPSFMAMLANSAGSQKEIDNLSKYLQNMPKSGSIYGPENKPEVMGTPSPNGTPTDSPSEFMSMYQTVFDKEQLQSVFTANPSAKANVIAVGRQAITSFNPNNLQPEDISAASKTIGAMFIALMPQIDKDGEGIKPNRVSEFMGNTLFNLVDSINSKDKTVGSSIYNQINTYAVNSTAKIADNFNKQMEVIKKTTVSPFTLKMDNKNNLTFMVNEEAIKTDPYLKKAMGYFKYETVGRGGTRAIPLPTPTETDPYKVLDNYLSLTGSSITEGAEKMFWVGGGTTNEVKRMVESLQIIARQSSKIPVDTRSQIDAIELLRQQYGKAP